MSASHSGLTTQSEEQVKARISIDVDVRRIKRELARTCQQYIESEPVTSALSLISISEAHAVECVVETTD